MRVTKEYSFSSSASSTRRDANLNYGWLSCHKGTKCCYTLLNKRKQHMSYGWENCEVYRIIKCTQNQLNCKTASTAVSATNFVLAEFLTFARKAINDQSMINWWFYACELQNWDIPCDHLLYGLIGLLDSWNSKPEGDHRLINCSCWSVFPCSRLVFLIMSRPYPNDEWQRSIQFLSYHMDDHPYATAIL